MTADILTQPLILRCGAVLRNRIGKAAMTEGLADEHNRATSRHEHLYRRWSNGGAGLLITGNVPVDRRHLERPGNVVVDDNGGLDRLRAYAKAGTASGNHLWMQLNHPGRQSPALVNPQPIAPSATPLTAKTFAPPRAMTGAEILDVIERFARAARIARDAGFTGVEIHSAHGYLLSQFLSPAVNRRQDEWGGPLENRARLLLSVIAAVRASVGSDFPVAVKLNSSDFQLGGFDNDEAAIVAGWVDAAGVDLLELSGGTYEKQQMSGRNAKAEPQKESTVKREAYFLDFAARVRAVVKGHLMVSGGFRTREGMEAALESGVIDMIGVGKPLTVDPEAIGKLLSGEINELSNHFLTLKLDPDEIGPDATEAEIAAAQAGFMGWGFMQVLRLGNGQEADLGMTIYQAYQAFQANEAAAAAALVGRARPDIKQAT